MVSGLSPTLGELPSRELSQRPPRSSMVIHRCPMVFRVTFRRLSMSRMYPCSMASFSYWRTVWTYPAHSSPVPSALERAARIFCRYSFTAALSPQSASQPHLGLQGNDLYHRPAVQFQLRIEAA